MVFFLSAGVGTQGFVSPGKCPITELQSSPINIFKQVFLALYFDLFISCYFIYAVVGHGREKTIELLNFLMYYSSSSVLGIEGESRGGAEKQLVLLGS